MVKIFSDERHDLIVHLTDLQEQCKNDHGLKSLIETLTTGREKESEIDKDGNINLHVYSLYELYHYTVSLEHQENQRRERILEILNPKLDVLLGDVPKFFRDAFESRKLYLYSNGNGGLFSFLKDNILLPIFHKDSGVVREYNELERIIPSIKNNINQEIGRINRFIANPPQLDYTEQEKRKLPFFDLLKSLISPKVVQDEKYDYAFLTSMINSKLEHEQLRFRAVQLKENKDLGAQDHRLGIDWNGNYGSNGTNENLFSHVRPACLSEKEDYEKLGIFIKNENGDKKLLHDFMSRYLKEIQSRHQIVNISNANEANSIAEFYSHIFLAEDRQDTNSHSKQKEHARLKLECKAPKYEDNDYNENFFIRMAFEPTEEPYVYKMTKEGRGEYHYSMIFRKYSFGDNDYIYVADDTIKVTEIADSTYKQAMSSVCSEVIKQADQKSYLIMTMHLVPTSGRSQASDLQRVYTDGATSSKLIPRCTVGIDNEGNLECDSQSSRSRIDTTSNPDAQNLPKGRLKADYFRIQSINFDRVSALVANKKLYQVPTNDTQPVEACIQAMQEKMNRVTGRENNLSNASRSNAPMQSWCPTEAAIPLIGATGGIHSPQCLDFSNINQCLGENWIIPNTPSPTSHSSRSPSPINGFEYVGPNDVIGREPEESFEILPTPSSELDNPHIHYNTRRSK